MFFFFLNSILGTYNSYIAFRRRGNSRLEFLKQNKHPPIRPRFNEFAGCGRAAHLTGTNVTQNARSTGRNN